MGEKQADFNIYEVFIQRTHTDHHVHAGSLVAPSPDVAIQTARENFLRREKAVNLWVVPREQITATPYEAEFFAREIDRKYREVAGYTENGRLWRMFKEKAISLDEIVAYVEGRKEKQRPKKQA
ncbi:phenylacetic acid degradation protein [Paenactinomyces guangxiensis]|uniref:Phenylacetic acid degradation protein n=1 Tax=Paenactinomyces guangxiensis TaxID=1490290 RepID=A0A7W1WNY8_9BACL|nr:phenylacetic acid degradation protein [Paenactinomyces guangxiensis]MBA4493403.1 phenylacetic acid degradation protein [Paenactinomyces guangxiensis]MBH8590494.1 phenylacetic acid degradation protein [Paenactinomyces guangxiensis]